jgi:hypothetical protein
MAKYLIQKAEKQVESGEDAHAVKKAFDNLEKDGFIVKKDVHRGGDKVHVTHIIVLLLRLRQICCHASLITEVIGTD